MNSALLLALTAAHMLVLAEEPAVWECDFGKIDQTQWKWHNAVGEPSATALRVRVPTVPQESGGSFGQQVSAAPAACYLQVLLGDMEDSNAAPTVGNASPGGKKFGPLLAGWNTFSMAHNAARPFLLSFRQQGNRREARGPWVDYRLARIVKTPHDGLVVSLKNKSDGIAQVGDTLHLAYYSSAPLAKNPTARFFLSPGLLEYRFAGAREIQLTDAEGKGVYTADVVIDKESFAFQSAGNKQRMMALATVNDVNRYCTLPFSLDIRTAHVLSPELAAAANMQVRDDRQRWLELTQGKNVALGKPVQFVPAPDYRLTTDPGDTMDLTDGKLSSRADDKLWFDREAVGWYFGGGPSYLRLDLGQEQPVAKVVIRCLGGTSGNFKFPARFELFVSRDGKHYHEAASMQKLMPNEAAQSDFVRDYYLEENASQYSTRVYPFALTANADARYVLLKITGASDSIFTDELAVIKAVQKDAAYNETYRQPGVEIPMEGLIIRPRVAELAMIRGIPAPQRFTINDLRPEPAKQEAAALVLELPQAVSVVGDYESKSVTHDGAAYRRYEFPLKRTGKKQVFTSPTLYLDVKGSAPQLPAYVCGRSGATDQFRTALPVQVVTLPEIPRFRQLHISLSWMGEAESKGWPDFLNRWRKLGFNSVATFPRYWNPQSHEENAKFVADARAAGYRVIMNDSAFHMMMQDQAEGSEIYCQIPGRKHKMLCPSYRGPFYAREMARVENCTRMSRPDYVFYDIECWHEAVSSAAECTRCRAAWKESGKSMFEFLFDCGARQLADLKQAVAKGAAAAGIPLPVIGSYSREALRPKYGIEMFERSYPASIDLAQPSLYVAGRAQDVHDRIRGNDRLMKNKKIIPWLTAGTYGEFASGKMEQMVLEALLNGAGGITYYCFGDFTDSPLDFFYHAKALAELRPYEDLVVEGEVLDAEGSNAGLTYSVLRRGDELLLLVGNYRNAEPRTVFPIPFTTVAEIKDVRSGQCVQSGSSFAFDVPKGDIRLFYIRQ